MSKKIILAGLGEQFHEMNSPKVNIKTSSEIGS